MEVRVKLEEPEDKVSVQSALTGTRSSPTPEEFSETEMTSAQVSLVPSNLARPPVLWSAQEVKAWLEFCVKEFSLPPVFVGKFDMNGKALLLLTRTDFMERAPHGGDVLFNVFQRLLQQEGPAYLMSPVFVPTPAHLISPSADLLVKPLQSARASYIPIRPQPLPHVRGSSGCCTQASTNNLKVSNIVLAAGEEIIPDSSSVPASMLSPAPSEKCHSDTDSSINETGQSPHNSDQDMDCEESMNFDPGREVKYDITDQQDDGVCRLLWEFIYQLLQDSKWSELVSWESVGDLTFRILNPTNLADAWGKQKNRSNMTYEKLSRALRYYYKMNIIKKVPGKRLTYKFLQHPATIRKGQRGARPHSNRTIAARTEETEQATTETATPDSLSFPLARTLPASSTSTAATLLTRDLSCNVGSSPNISNFASEDNETKTHTGHSVFEQHFLNPSQNIQCDNKEQGSLLCRDVSDVNTSETVSKVGRSLSVSPRQLAYMSQKHQLKYCDVRDNCESDDRNKYSRSGCSTFNNSSPPEQNYNPLAMKDIEYLHMTSGPLNDGSVPHALSALEDRPHSYSYYERKHHLHKSAQDLTRDVDALSRSSSPSSTSSKRSLTPQMFHTLKSPGHNKQYILYPNSTHHHPYHHPVPFNRTPPHQPNIYGQLRPNHLSTDFFPVGSEHQFTNRSGIIRHASDFHLQHSNGEHYIRHPLKRELEQVEPEDLSIKACVQKGDSSTVKSEPAFPHGSGVKDEHRDSPRSCSSDSAYSSDPADFGKEGSVG